MRATLHRLCLVAALAASGCNLVVHGVVQGARPDASSDASSDADRDAGPAHDAARPDADVDGGPAHACESQACEEIGRVISRDTRWDASTIRVLREQTYVLGDTTLTIAAGAVVLGDGGALVVSPRARLIVEGTRDTPVVFTSYAALGTERAAQPGDWGGIVLLGDAPAQSVRAQVPGLDYSAGTLPSSDPSVYTYGGSDPAADCGRLRFLRVEHAGQLATSTAPMAGLTLAGCGAPTSLDFVQVSASSHVGLLALGGAPDLAHVALTANRGDGLAWSDGFAGRIQFLVVLQGGGARAGGRGVRGASNGPAAAPVSSPTIYNATLVGPPPDQPSGELEGIRLEAGSGARIGNALVLGFREPCLDMDGDTIGRFGADAPLSASVLDRCGADGTRYLSAEVRDASNGLGARLAAGNQLGGGSGVGLPLDRDAPVLAPAVGSPADTLGEAPPEDGFFAQTATYAGAVAPGAESPWTLGWARLGR